MAMNRARVWVACTMGAAAACAGERTALEESASATEAFCAEVMPRVDAFLADARAQHPAPSDERYGGTAVVGGIGPLAGGLNAFVAGDYSAVQHMQFVNLMTLVDYDADFEPRPYLAESWEVGDDGTSVTFHLRRDVTWHDGEPTDAHDVAFTFDRITDPASPFSNPGFWTNWVTDGSGVEVVDDYTITLRMTPHAQFIDPWRTVGIMPEHLLRDVPVEELGEHPFGLRCPVGNGPFVFREVEEGDHWTFAANPAFSPSLGGRPFLDRYVYREIRSPATLMAELRAGGVDVYVQVTPEQADQIAATDDLDLHRAPSRQYGFVAWNARRPQLADARVRRALTHATDRAGFVENFMRGYGRVANSSVPSVHWAYSADQPVALAYDPARARALLDEAGWSDRDGDGVRENADGVRLSVAIKYNTGNLIRQTIAELMQAQLAEVGVEARAEGMDYTTLLGQVYFDTEARDFDGVVLSWTVEFRLDDSDTFHSLRHDRPAGFSGTSNSRLDALLEALDRTVDRAEALPLWEEYQAVLIEEQPYTFFYSTDRINGVNPRLHGVEMDARGEWLAARKWWIDPGGRR